MASYKPVGINEDSLFPPRVMAGLDERYLGQPFDRFEVVVTDHGMIGDKTFDNSTVFTQILEEHAGKTIRVPAGDYYLASPAVVPNTLRSTLVCDPGATFWVGDNAALTCWGDATGNLGSLTSDIGSSDRFFTIPTPSTPIAVGDTVMIFSMEGLPGATGNKFGSMRRITSVSVSGTNTTYGIDTPVQRSLTVAKSAGVFKLLLHVGIEIRGGTFSALDPENMISGLISFRGVENPIMVGSILGPSGRTGVTTDHCFGGYLEVHAHDLLDDLNNQHVGYGVNCAGSTRDLVVRGSGTRCRHAFTTNTGGTLGGMSSGLGEPWNIDVDMSTADCTNKALDTHRAGHTIRMKVRNVGGYGAVQVRADAVIVEGTSIGTRDSGFSVASNIVIPPIFNNCVNIDMTDASPSYGFYTTAGTPGVVFNNCSTFNNRVSFYIQAPNCVINGGVVRGIASNIGAGVIWSGRNLVINGLVCMSTGTALVENEGSENPSLLNVRFINCGVETSLLTRPAGQTNQPPRFGRALSTGSVGTQTGYIPILNTDGDGYRYIPLHTL